MWYVGSLWGSGCWEWNVGWVEYGYEEYGVVNRVLYGRDGVGVW